MTLAPGSLLLSPRLPEALFIATQHREFWREQELEWDASPRLRSDAGRFAVSVYERALDIIGRAHVTSGYRCPALNRAVGGRVMSRHMLGMALDLVPLDHTLTDAMERLANAVRAGAIPDADEILIEHGWLHLQGAPIGVTPRRLLLATRDGVHFAPLPKAKT